MISRRMFSLLSLLAAGAFPTWRLLASQPQKRTANGGLKHLNPKVRFVSPTVGQRVLDGSMRKGVFMDTGTGKPESGMFGNVRKFADGSPRFHEGIDIAPAAGWKRNALPTDIVRAAAEGLVVYVNTYTTSPSLYGNYVVMTHTIEGFGEIYTLYGHLRAFARGLRAGMRLESGSPLGIMGNIPDIPVGRAHLHFEIGVMMNRYYPWIDDDHGVWNGGNLYGIDPCMVYRQQKLKGAIDFAELIHTLPEAFAIAIPSNLYAAIDYFHRYIYPIEKRPASHVAVSFSKEGIPIRVERMPLTAADSGKCVVLRSDATEIAKGRAFVKAGELTKRGEALLNNLLLTPRNVNHHPAVWGEIG